MNALRATLADYGRRTLILTHRYLGIAISLMLVVWFASGIVMMYAGGMPQLDPQQRLARMPTLDFSRVQLTPAQAAERAGAGGGAPVLLTVQGRPAYRYGTQTIFADDGSELAPLDAVEAALVARQFAAVPAEVVHLERQVDEVDQWTMNSRRDLPLFKFRVDDGQGTELYVSPRTAEVVQATTTRTRALAWVGTIPHWIYFASLRQNQPLWYQLVVWLSALACVLAVLGLVLAWTQWRKTRPFRLKTAIPYRGGMRWHYISGTLFGIFALTWAFSGLLSMEPWGWTNAEGLDIDRGALSGGRVELADYPAFDGATLNALAAPAVIKEVSFQRIQDAHYYALHTVAPAAADRLKAERLHQPYAVAGRGQRDRLLVRAGDLAPLEAPFSTESIVQRLAAAAPQARIIEQALLADYDDYYYSRGRQTALPVLRVKFDDPMQTWVYVDPATSSIVAQVHRYSRIERWLYNGLHSLDFRFWYSRRPLWDIGMILLLLGGLASSGIGLYMGVRRLVRGALPRRKTA